ncbi:MAG: hypothetical protein VX216_03680 [Candidatus Thermoplasmatota archaeon]|nr:hypothetical protein [Candidatus Thermoplasmatota archaeon]
MDPINCMHVEPNGKTCPRVAYNRLYYCRTHSNLYPDAGTRKDAPPRPETGSERDARMRGEVSAPDNEPPVEEQIAEETPEEVPEVTDWDEVQKEEGWWDDALPDATPEEQMKEALANAETSGKSLSAEQIYTVTSLGGEVTTEMFDPSISARFRTTVRLSVLIVVLCVVAPLALVIADIAIFLGRIFNFEFRTAADSGDPLGWASLGFFVWTPQFLIGAATFGAAWGFYDHWTKSRALKRGKADYLDSQEDA